MPRNIDDLLLPVPNGTRLSVVVKPRSKAFSILISDQIVINCRSPAKKGRANREVLGELSRVFNRRVRIISGHKSRSKMILVESMKSEKVREILRATQREPDS